MSTCMYLCVCVCVLCESEGSIVYRLGMGLCDIYCNYF